MINPWNEISLSDYENHMALQNVYQLQTLDKVMWEQFSSYPVSSVAILGVAGGNGLGNLSDMSCIRDIYGIDINRDYLDVSAARHPELKGRYHTVLADINSTECVTLPAAELVVTNLFIEYVGCRNFALAIDKMNPSYVSCVIQVDPEESFVSDSPYTSKLESLDPVHSSIDSSELTETLEQIDYRELNRYSYKLPNGKEFHRIDFVKKQE